MKKKIIHDWNNDKVKSTKKSFSVRIYNLS